MHLRHLKTSADIKISGHNVNAGKVIGLSFDTGQTI
jgi:hypothetical protein